MARRKRLSPPPVWLAPVLGGFLILLTALGAVMPAVPLSTGEAAEWRRALGGPFLPLDAPPLGSWILRIALFVGGDMLASLRLSSLAMLAVLLGCLAPRGRMALIAGLSSPLVWWLVLSGLNASVLLAAAAPFALLLERAAAPRPKREKTPPLRPWLWLGLSGAVLLHGQPLLIGAMVVLFALLIWRGVAWRGPVLALGVIAVLALPFVIWSAATAGAPLLGALPVRGSSAWWELAMAVLALGPLLLGGLRGSTDTLGLWIWSVIALGIALALLERGSPLLTAVLVAPLALRQAGSALRGWRLIALGGVGAPVGAMLLAASMMYAAFGEGLPAITDPHAARRADAAFCEDVLLTMEEEGAVSLIGASRAPLLPCAWRGGLRDTPVIGMTTDGPLPLRVAQGPLAVEGDGVLVAFWPDDGLAMASQFANRRKLGARSVPDHAGSERRYTLWLVRDWTGG